MKSGIINMSKINVSLTKHWINEFETQLSDLELVKNKTWQEDLMCKSLQSMIDNLQTQLDEDMLEKDDEH